MCVLELVARIFGYKRIPVHIGHWSIVNGRFHRDLIQIGWRWGKIGEPENETCLDRILREQR